MCTTFSVSRRICLLTLAVMMVFSASQAFAFGQIVPCCSNFSSRKIHSIKKCFEQKPRQNCDHAFLIKNKKDKWLCIKPDAAWLKEKIETGKITCPPDVSF